MTKEQAQLIVEDLGIRDYVEVQLIWKDLPEEVARAYHALLAFADVEKVLMLQKYNPVLLRAYRALLAFAEGVEEP